MEVLYRRRAECYQGGHGDLSDRGGAELHVPGAARWCAADPGPLRSVTVPDRRCTATQELRAAPHPGHGRGGALFDRDIRFADDAGVVVEHPLQIGAEFRTAYAHWKQP